jgi:hypothetical protein
MKFTRVFAAAMTALVVSSGALMAEPTASTDKAATATTTTTKPVKVAKTKKPEKLFVAKSEKGKECSAQADAQKLHGKARRHFRKKCMKAAKPA